MMRLSLRGRRMVSSLISGIGSFAIIISILGFLVLSFVGSRAAVSSSTYLVLARADMRRAVAVELVSTLKDSGNLFAQIIIDVADDQVTDVIEVALNDEKLRIIAREVVSGVYEVYVNDAPSVTIDIQPFAESTFLAIQSVNPLFFRIGLPRIQPLKISQDEQDPDVGAMIATVRVATWVCLLLGIVLLAITWLLSIASFWIQLRRLGIRFLSLGLALTVLASVVPLVSFGKDHRALYQALAHLVANRLQSWSIVLAVTGLLVTGLAEISRRKPFVHAHGND